MEDSRHLFLFRLSKRKCTFNNKGKLPFEFASILIILFFHTILFVNPVVAQETTKSVPDSTTQVVNTEILADSSSQVKTKKPLLDAKVEYDSEISQTLKLSQGLMILKGNAKVRYEKIKLEAEIIEYNFKEKTVYAYGVQDSTGAWYGLPKFEDNGQSYDASEIRYNFETKRGFIRDVKTKLDNDGHLRGEKVKKEADEVLFMENGEFCPCKDPEAKTRIKVNKVKVIQNDKIITGPGYLKIGKIPTPLAFPFGFFPNKQEQAAGVVIPTYGESDLGFFLINGGYYTPLGQHADLQILGDIYTRGSWAYKIKSNYKKRYGYNGNINFNQNTLIAGDPDLGNESTTKTYGFQWRHSQDPKSRPNSRFMANVNVGSVNRFRNTVNVSAQNYLSSTFNSSLTYDKSWQGKPFNFGASARYSQNTANETATLSLPELNFSVNRFNLPLSFLNPTQSGNKWYERIGMTYNANMRNTITTEQSQLSMNNLDFLQRNMKNGVRHSSSISTSIKKWHLNVNPSLNLTERWYFQQLSKSFNPDSNTINTDTIQGFNRFADYSANVSVNTKVFGMFRYKKGPIQAIRHVLTPTVGLSYRPQAFKLPTVLDSNGVHQEYSPYQGAIFGGPSTQESGLLNFGLQNNLEMKTRGEKEQKIKILDNLNFTSSYDLFKDSLNWSNISMNARTTLFKRLNVVYSGSYDPYQRDPDGVKINRFIFENGQGIAKLQNGNFNVGFSTNDKDFAGIFDENKENNPAADVNESEAETAAKKDHSFSFNFGTNYTLNMRRLRSSLDTDSIGLTQGLSFQGNLGVANLFKIGFSSGYDFKTEKLTYTNLTLYVDLNCWELNLRMVPIGAIKSYSLRLNMKSNLLKDVKLEQNRNLVPGEDNFFR